MPSRPCLGCGKIGPNRRCQACESARNKARDAIRGNSSQRGLGGEHRRQVAALIAAYIVEHGEPPTHCPRCGHTYVPGTKHALSGEHSVARIYDKASLADSLACVSCNASAGARIRRLA